VPDFGMPTAAGMVRELAYDLDPMTVAVTSHHVEQYGS